MNKKGYYQEPVLPVSSIDLAGVEISQLISFLIVAEVGSFRRGATRLRRSAVAILIDQSGDHGTMKARGLSAVNSSSETTINPERMRVQ